MNLYKLATSVGKQKLHGILTDHGIARGIIETHSVLTFVVSLLIGYSKSTHCLDNCRRVCIRASVCCFEAALTK